MDTTAHITMIESKNESSTHLTQAPMSSSLVSEAQRLLFQASFLKGEPAVRAWKRWKTSYELDAIDSESFQLLPLVYLTLARLEVKDTELAKLRGVYKRTWLSNQKVMRSLLEVLHLLETAGTSIFLQRSLALIILQYYEQGAFPVHAIDLLIRPEELGTVDSLLQNAGWQLKTPLPPKLLLPLVHGTSYTHHKWSELFLHWRPFTIDCSPDLETQLWQRATQHTFNGITANIPDVNDLLLLICLQEHDIQSYSMSRSLVEAALLIQATGSSIDWEAVHERAKRLGMQERITTVLKHLYRDFKLEQPKKLSDQTAYLTRPSEDHLRLSKAQSSQVQASWGIRESLARMWNSYRIVSSFDKQNSNPMDFIFFFLSYYQFSWGIRRKWLIPLMAFKKVVRRLGQGRVLSLIIC